MNKLVAEVVKHIRERMRSAARSLPGNNALRSVFHGPPLPYMHAVLESFMSEGLEVQFGDGEHATIPVLLPIDGYSHANPTVGVSGLCDDSHILALRNTPACPRFLTLTTPARHSILSIAQATDEFGLGADHNGASSGMVDWWNDSFVSHLVDAALNRVAWASEPERTHAKKLLHGIVMAADEVDRHDPQRLHAWASLARVIGLAGPVPPPQMQWALACGVPPTKAGDMDADGQLRILHRFADAMVDEGFSSCVERLKRSATNEEATALDKCVRSIEDACEVRTALARAAQYYYAPFRGDEMGAPPEWWATLTAERLGDLLDEDVAPEGALAIRCTNTIVPAGAGLPAIVVDEARFEVQRPAPDADPIQVSVYRSAGAKANAGQWTFDVRTSVDFADDAIPAHRQPVRYLVEADGLKGATARVVSLAAWEPGIVVSCRSAKKLSLPKKARQGPGLECQVTLAGEGRHYLDLLATSGTTVEEEVTGEDTAASDAHLEAAVTVSADGAYGLELVATPECRFSLKFRKAGGEPQDLVIQVSCEELPVEGCRSEFERLIRLNRQRDRASSMTVQLDRQVRIADLESWMLDAGNVDRSFYPLALGPDCRDKWGAPSWASPATAVISRGAFLHDPRPLPDEFTPPGDWLEARRQIAARVRGDDGYGLVEAAEFAIWMKEPEFANTVSAYVRSYLGWLDAAPDVASWVDTVIVCPLEADGRTLAQEPDALIVSPIHPLRLGWHCVAQRTLEEAWRAGMPCPAASILDPDSLPDAAALPLRSPSGATKRAVFLATECSSDYWSVLWNGGRLGALATRGNLEPFDHEFGIRLGGVSSGFSVSQVRRALDDVSTLLSAKPILNVLVSSSTGHSDACNEGLTSWAKDSFASQDTGEPSVRIGSRMLHVFDERRSGAPEHAELANLSEDTNGAAVWYKQMAAGVTPDLGIIAQLETSNAEVESSDIGTPLGVGALLRHRIRMQLKAGVGAFISESRMGVARPPSGDGLADAVMSVAARLENQTDTRQCYTFAPSVKAVSALLKDRRAEYVAVSSSAVDPSCFLGGWLEDSYLWDYELPSYSHRSGDTNGYYLLSQVRALDCEALQELLKRLPGCEDVEPERLKDLLLEVSRRGVPTVRGLSASHSGAAGDLGLFLAGRVLQDEFRRSGDGPGSLLRLVARDGASHELALVIPVDPFRAYLQDLQRAVGTGHLLRPDLIVATVVLTDSSIRCKLTPVEVKYRRDVMSPASCGDALSQSASLAALLEALNERASRPDQLLWRLCVQHLLLSMLDFGFRVYSQHVVASQAPREWSSLHQRVMASILSEELGLEVDPTGRLIVFDASPASAPRDVDGDGFRETIVLRPTDAAVIVNGPTAGLYGALRAAIGDWSLFPRGTERLQASEATEGVTGGTTESRRAVGPTQERVAFDAGAVPPAAVTSEPPAIAEAGEEAQGMTEPRARTPMRVYVGETLDGFKTEPRYLSPSDTALNQLNMGVVGDLGTGKTQLLKSLVYQIVGAAPDNAGVKPRVLIFDYKNDYTAPDFVAAVGAKVVQPRHLPLNLFDISAATGETVPWMNRFRFFADVLDKIYSNVGPVQRDHLKQSVKQAYQECAALGRQPTVYDVYERYGQRVQGRPDSPLSIIGDIVDMELFSPVPGDGSGFGAFFDGVVVISLDALGQDDQTKHMLVAFMLNMFYEHMLRIPKRPYVGSSPQLRVVDSYLLVDEADNIMRYEFDVLRKILLQGREFGVGVILASQYLKHFRAGATDYREPLLSWFIHKVPNITAQELSAIGLTGPATQMADRIRQLENHQCLYKTFDVPGEMVTGVPFYKHLSKRAGS